jgi:hypothetical protein
VTEQFDSAFMSCGVPVKWCITLRQFTTQTMMMELVGISKILVF